MDRNTDKGVLKKMVLMYIRENINTNINHTVNIDKIVEEVVKELVSNRSSKTPIYIDMPIMSIEEPIISTPTPSPLRIVEPTHYYCIRRQSILFRSLMVIREWLMSHFNNQETYQRYQAISSLMIELFRSITSSLMILFVPQSCGDDICNFHDILQFDYGLKGIGLTVNFITLFSFIILYWIEMWRENRLIKYLDVNPNLPTDLEYISSIMDILPEDKKKKIISSNEYYRYITYTTIIIYIVNAILSGIIIHNSYLNNQTHSTYITYVIFMITKLSNAYGVIYYRENLYYSAYLKTNIQFNDIDRNYKKVIDV